jgi:hypothetical protein
MTFPEVSTPLASVCPLYILCVTVINTGRSQCPLEEGKEGVDFFFSSYLKG